METCIAERDDGVVWSMVVWFLLALARMFHIGSDNPVMRLREVRMPRMHVLNEELAVMSRKAIMDQGKLVQLEC